MSQLFEKVVSALSVTPVCPRCKQTIPSEDINVANDVAFCRRCDLSHGLSALAMGTRVDEDVDVVNPPSGAWFHRDMSGVVMGATHRSLGQAFGLFIFAAFWNGIVSVFVSFAAASTLQHFGVLPPKWLHPAHAHAMPVGMTVFLWVFLTPFIGIGLLVASACLSSIMGRTELRVLNGECSIFTGIGPLGIRRRFPVSAVTDVRIEGKTWRDNTGTSHRNANIVIDTRQKPVYFGSMLSNERRRFIAGAAKKELVRG